MVRDCFGVVDLNIFDSKPPCDECKDINKCVTEAARKMEPKNWNEGLKT